MKVRHLSEIDDSNRHDHFRISPDDKCYYIFELSASDKFVTGSTKSLIANLKKKPSLRGTAQYKYKAPAIREVQEHFTNLLNEKWLESGTLVPVPPSKTHTHPDYDDRMLQVCNGIGKPGSTDVRELVLQTQDISAFHEDQSNRLSVEDLVKIYQIDESVTDPPPTSILIVDDVLTAGTHYRAVHQILSNRFPEAKIYGAFVARWKRPDLDLSDFKVEDLEF